MHRAEENDAFNDEEFGYDGVGGEEEAEVLVESEEAEDSDGDGYCVDDGQL